MFSPHNEQHCGSSQRWGEKVACFFQHRGRHWLSWFWHILTEAATTFAPWGCDYSCQKPSHCTKMYQVCKFWLVGSGGIGGVRWLLRRQSKSCVHCLSSAFRTNQYKPVNQLFSDKRKAWVVNGHNFCRLHSCLELGFRTQSLWNRWTKSEGLCAYTLWSKPTATKRFTHDQRSNSCSAWERFSEKEKGIYIYIYMHIIVVQCFTYYIWSCDDTMGTCLKAGSYDKTMAIWFQIQFASMSSERTASWYNVVRVWKNRAKVCGM